MISEKVILESRTENAIGAELQTLVHHAVGAELVSCIPITTLPTADGLRSSFRLEFSDGLLLKGKYVQSSEIAGRIEGLLGFLSMECLPKLLGRLGKALLFEWIEGRALDLDSRSLGIFCKWGRFQASLHSLPLPSMFLASPRNSVQEWIAWIEANLEYLKWHEMLGSSERKSLRDLVLDQAPAFVENRLIHGDLCGENIVVGACGRSFLVDNETLRVDSPEFDLARSWYRWPMTPSESKAYIAGYSELRSPGGFREHSTFWKIAALSGAAAFRIRTKAPGLERPLSFLRDLVHT